jgi:hypothetical protein
LNSKIIFISFISSGCMFKEKKINHDLFISKLIKKNSKNKSYFKRKFVDLTKNFVLLFFTTLNNERERERKK